VNTHEKRLLLSEKEALFSMRYPLKPLSFRKRFRKYRGNLELFKLVGLKIKAKASKCSATIVKR